MIEMPDSVWQGMNANCDEMTIALSNLQTSMDFQMPEVKFLREVAHAMARLTTLVGRQKKYIRDCYIGNIPVPVDAFPEEHDGEKRQARAEAYGEDR